MNDHFRAEKSPHWQARITGRHAMAYRDGPSAQEDRPPHVRAASGLSAFREYIAVIQDDANWLALIDAERRVTAVPLPPGPGGRRVFSEERGNKDDKYDLEACVTVKSGEGLELVGFSSGSRDEREWVLRVGETGAPAAGGPPQLRAEFVPAAAFFRAIRGQTRFCGAALNIEGALALDDDRIRLFQRGNARPGDGAPPVDATGDFAWSELCAHLAAPDRVRAPRLGNVRTYDLGKLDGVRLTFSDAEHLGGGRVLYSASAEHPDSGDIHGSVLGIIEPGGQARWTELVDEAGQRFAGKIEGLTRDLADPSKIHFVIDNDDGDSPSCLFEAVLSHHFLDEEG